VYERPPGIEDNELAAILASEWGLQASGLEYLPVGFGGFHWQAVDQAGARWFITVTERAAGGSVGGGSVGGGSVGGDGPLGDFEAAMETAASLATTAGLDFVVAPERTRGGRALAWFGPGSAVTVFPYCDGAPGRFGDVLTSTERSLLTTTLAALHRSTAVIDTERVPVRGLGLAERDVLTESLRELGDPWPGGPYSEPARAALREHADGLCRALARFDALVERVSSDGRSLVVTHGEPHPGNIIRSASRLALVDWDTVGLAPPERDLWWVLAAGDQEAVWAGRQEAVWAGRQEAGRYAELTGRDVSADALALYRLRWTLDDVSLFLAEFRDLHSRTADTELSWSGFSEGLAALSRS
jgi:spectinomycin phosphotransferase